MLVIIIIRIIIIKFIGYLFYSMVGGRVGRWDALGRNFKSPPRKLIIEKVLFFASHCVPASPSIIHDHSKCC